MPLQMLMLTLWVYSLSFWLFTLPLTSEIFKNVAQELLYSFCIVSSSTGQKYELAHLQLPFSCKLETNLLNRIYILL